MAVLRKRVLDVLKNAGLADAERDIRASGFINLVLGDAYLKQLLALMILTARRASKSSLPARPASHYHKECNPARTEAPSIRT